jgi:hypothetical protein
MTSDYAIYKKQFNESDINHKEVWCLFKKFGQYTVSMVR